MRRSFTSRRRSIRAFIWCRRRSSVRCEHGRATARAGSMRARPSGRCRTDPDLYAVGGGVGLMPRPRRTEVYYGLRYAPGQMARVLRTDTGFEILASRWHFFTILLRRRGWKMRILDTEIEKVRRFARWQAMIIEYGNGREVFLRSDVLADVPPEVELPIVDEAPEHRVGKEIAAMRSRQGRR